MRLVCQYMNSGIQWGEKHGMKQKSYHNTSSLAFLRQQQLVKPLYVTLSHNVLLILLTGCCLSW